MPRAIRTIAGLAMLAALLAAQPAVAAFEIGGTFGSEGAGDGQFNLVAGAAVGPNGQLHVVDGNNNRVQRFGLDGSFQGKFGVPGGGAGQFNSPSGVAIDGAGNVFVVDAGNYRVQKFDANGNFIQVIGSLGQTDPSQFRSNPREIAADSAGNVYVTEAAHRVLKFAGNGTFLTTWGSSGSGDGQFNSPEGIAIDPNATVWVADQSNSRIQHFSADGQFLGKFGTPGNQPGQLRAPQALLALPGGNLLVGDDNLRNLQEFRPDGSFVASLPGSAAPGGSFRPHGLARAASGEIYLTDTEVNIGDRVLIVRQVPDAPTEPVIAESVAVETVRGEVTFKSPGASSFQRLEGNQIIPVGSAIDVSKGTVGMTAASRAPGVTQKGDFTGGRFRVTQAPSSLTTLRLQGGSFASCRRNVGNARTAQRRRIRRLSGNARGRFRTRGRHSTATVRGTRWTMEDRCDGTLTRVRSGVVVVRDFAKRRNIRLRRGGRYLARPRRR